MLLAFIADIVQHWAGVGLLVVTQLHPVLRLLVVAQLHLALRLPVVAQLHLAFRLPMVARLQWEAETGAAWGFRLLFGTKHSSVEAT
jgi:hypothetical protein